MDGWRKEVNDDRDKEKRIVGRIEIVDSEKNVEGFEGIFDVDLGWRVRVVGDGESDKNENEEGEVESAVEKEKEDGRYHAGR